MKKEITILLMGLLSIFIFLNCYISKRGDNVTDYYTKEMTGYNAWVFNLLPVLSWKDKIKKCTSNHNRTMVTCYIQNEKGGKDE